MVGGVGFEFGCAGVHRLEHGGHAELLAGGADFGLLGAGLEGDLLVAESPLLGLTENVHTQVGQTFSLQLLDLEVDQILDVGQKPWIVFPDGMDALDAPAALEGGAHAEKPVGLGLFHVHEQLHFGVGHLLVLAVATESAATGLQAAEPLLQRLLERATDRHRLAHRLHLGAQRVGRAWELLEVEARDLGHHVIDARLEAAGSRSRDVVGDFGKRVAHGELGRDLGDGKSRGFGGQRRRAAHPRVHLDDHHAAVFRIHGELHVRSTRFHPDLAQDRDRGIAHALVFLVGERLGRGHRDGVAGVDAHGVQVLD